MMKIKLITFSFLFSLSLNQEHNIESDKRTTPSFNDELCAIDKDCTYYPFNICGTEGFCIHKEVFPVH